MILKLDGKSQTLVQVTSQHTGEVIGLYLVPEGIDIDKFEKTIVRALNQYDFDKNNTLGIERVFVYNSILDIDF